MSQKQFESWLEKFMDGTANWGGAAPNYTITFDGRSRALSSLDADEQKSILLAIDGAAHAATEGGNDE